MNLLKVRDGRLELDNFYTNSDFADFLNKGGTHKDFDDNSLYIDTNERIERTLNYNNFLIEIRKENWEELNDDEKFTFYVGDSVNEYGISEDKDEPIQKQFQKIIYSEGYVQCYVSDDGKSWQNLGGVSTLGENIIKQGFQKISTKSAKLIHYAVYTDPFLTIQNFPEGYSAKLFDETNTLIKERLFDINNEAKIFLDYNINGYLVIYDLEGNEVIRTDQMNFSYGNTFVACDYKLEMIYKDQVLPNEEVTEIDTYGSPQLVTLKNISDNQTYNNLTLTTETLSDDLIELSLDNINFSESITIPNILPNEEVDIYININRGKKTPTFSYREFLFKVI
ncbi:hypothetical protein AR9_g062 [Bacillus phage AR9]|uniref:Uncharacterized protein n=1 Tax=Bacillus phage AR9 TaxID=1815509 RepID=A0A172JHW9_BPPB1|nr:hypothetical protein BI022_gp061 [Bacillus phage AR9]AMS01146.1 hypothetical protein AR9_g062 [Bacillus phage AR9]